MSYYTRLENLPLKIESYELEPHELQVSSGMNRLTTEVVLTGGGHEGRGEDVSYGDEDQLALQAAPRDLPLAFAGTFGEFSNLIGSLDTFPKPPTSEDYRNYRRWAFESAALDLALRQAGVSFDQAVGNPYQPVRFVLSLRLGEPPSFDRVGDWLTAVPSLEFKLDAESSWSRELMTRLAETSSVESIDLKGLYHGSPVDQPPDPELYAAVLELFPTQWIEDPAIDDDTRAIITPALDRVTWDAPIHSVADIKALEHTPRGLNIKPSRFGALSELLAAVEFCEQHQIQMYSGGQFELSVGREQLHAIASAFFPEGPNDVAPVEFHSGVPSPDVPTSPLAPPVDPQGFRWRHANAS